jgi:hypothetical protein
MLETVRRTASETQRGVEKVYLPGPGVPFTDVGRSVIPPDDMSGIESGQHPFYQSFGADTSVLGALGSPGTPPLRYTGSRLPVRDQAVGFDTTRSSCPADDAGDGRETLEV